MKKKKKGFTLVELLVVIAIIAILAAIIAPNAFKAIEKSKVATAEADYKAIKTAALSYYSDTGDWPATSANDTGFVKDPIGLKGWNGPYLEKWPNKNPWGGSYIFRKNSNGSVDVPIGASASNNYKYLELDKVNSKAIERLEADLDGDNSGTTGVVRYDTNKTTVYLIISEQ